MRRALWVVHASRKDSDEVARLLAAARSAAQARADPLDAFATT